MMTILPVLTALMRSDHKIKYIAHAFSRATVINKLAALASIKEENFRSYFKVCDLKLDRWNDIDNLEVKPIFSPHPTETTIYLFRTLDQKIRLSILRPFCRYFQLRGAA